MVKPKATLEIVPENRFIVFEGDQYECQPIKLRGMLRLMTPEAMKMGNPRIRLEGKQRIQWYNNTGLGIAEVLEKQVIYEKEHTLSLGGVHKVRTGTVEWPFEFVLDPSMAESVEGIRDTWLVYTLHATVSRPGWNTKDLHDHTHIRIVRSLGPNSMDVTRSRVNADIWANKVSYSIAIPTDTVIFGTHIAADIELSPLKKGLKMGNVDMALIETTVKRMEKGERAGSHKREEIEVAKESTPFPETSKMLVENEDAENPTLEDERYSFQATMPLPRSLKRCRQDVDLPGISITHQFRLAVNIHNPEGHTSQLLCKFPIKLFISSNLPLNEQNEVQGSLGTATTPDSSVADPVAGSVAAPPSYGQHILDLLYYGVDASRVTSRRNSMSTTHSGFTISRSASTDNMPAITPGQVTSDLLRARLSRLPVETPSSSSEPSSRRPSHEAARTSAVAPQQNQGLGVDVNFLSRVPSYGSAMQAGAPPPILGLPSYIEATSRPPSPEERAALQSPTITVSTSPIGSVS
ncbi:hypothetical protein K470DRAFT_261039 [Piedraia hortae CBS 480.64]|uniref:Arrestin C-terminal-like domain-containing protein n=1 Tax=Piedraia hortae CBS 480.64 TaxID=1314780 RepID=A0A6A7BPI9_9PEZI|nr:hypothetical protein K470DRAFT_261039 [Piedraia hortae CBS 480.64]